MDSIVCWICRRRIPSALKNAHHAKPQAAGGGPDDLVDLCAGCHHNLHRIQDMLSGPRASQAEDTCKAYYSDNAGGARRCMELAIKCVRHMSDKLTGKYQVKAHDDIEIMLEIPHAVKNALMILGRETRDPRTNRRLGMQGMARHLLIEAIVKRFPALQQQIKDSIQAARKENPDQQYVRPRRRVKERGGEPFDVETSE